MTTTDHSGEQLTRRQLRELRLTGQTPVVAGDAAVEDSAPADPVPPRRDAPVNNPLPRPAEPIVVAPPATAPAPSADVPGRRLTRRELRDLERVRTASVPVIRTSEDEGASSADEAAATAVAPAVERASIDADQPVAAVDTTEAPAAEKPTAADDAVADAPQDSSVAAEPTADDAAEESAVSEASVSEAPVSEAPVSEAPASEAPSSEPSASEAPIPATAAPEPATPAPARAEAPAPAAEQSRPAWAPPVAPASGFGAPVTETSPQKEAPATVGVAGSDGPTLSSSFGAQVAPGASSGERSFDELISRDSGGSTAAGHSLVLPDSALPPLTAPVTSTGAMLVTGTFNLPELGSHGHAPGVADGKEVDAVLIDGELPAASSPTPIAATAAVSQAKAPGEIIKPPVPEKSNKLMLVLAITAGVLALALVGVIVGAALTGMMQ